MPERRLVHVRIIREGELFVAQCLEYDICAQGDSPVKALEIWRITAMGQVALDKRLAKQPLAAMPCAPIPYWCDIRRDDLVGVHLDELLEIEIGESK
jgi:hypothetical protein